MFPYTEGRNCILSSFFVNVISFIVIDCVFKLVRSPDSKGHAQSCHLTSFCIHCHIVYIWKLFSSPAQSHHFASIIILAIIYIQKHFSSSDPQKNLIYQQVIYCYYRFQDVNRSKQDLHTIFYILFYTNFERFLFLQLLNESACMY